MLDPTEVQSWLASIGLERCAVAAGESEDWCDMETYEDIIENGARLVSLRYLSTPSSLVLSHLACNQLNERLAWCGIARVHCADDERQIAAFAAEMRLSGDERQV